MVFWMPIGGDTAETFAGYWTWIEAESGIRPVMAFAAVFDKLAF